MTVLGVRVKDGQGAEISNFLGYGFNFGFAAAFDIALHRLFIYLRRTSTRLS